MNNTELKSFSNEMQKIAISPKLLFGSALNVGFGAMGIGSAAKQGKAAGMNLGKQYTSSNLQSLGNIPMQSGQFNGPMKYTGS